MRRRDRTVGGVRGAGTAAPTRLENGLVALSALVVAAVMAIGITVPSLWWDEIATVSGSARSLPDLFVLARTVDLVHLPYYLLLHGWLQIVPVDEFWLRLPSALATGATVPVVYGVGRMLSGRPVAIVAAVAFVAVPRTAWAATEARSFALGTLLAALVVLAFLAAARTGRTLLVTTTAVVAILSVLVWIYTAAVLLALLALLPGVAAGRRRAALAASVLVPIAVTAPFLLAVVGQRGQVGGTRPADRTLVFSVGVEQWFLEGGLVGAVGFWAAFGALLVIAVVRRGTAGVHRARDTAPIRSGGLVMLALWIVLPIGVVVAASRLLGHSLYQPRAFAFTTPALALLFAVMAVRAAGARWAVIVVAVLLAASIPSFVGVRQPGAKGTEWREAADAAAASASGPTALVFVDDWTTAGLVSHVPSPLALVYGQRLAGLDDVAWVEPPTASGGLWPIRRGLDEWAELLAGYDRVVVIRGTPDGSPETGGEVLVLTEDGFARDAAHRVGATTVEVWTR